MAGLCWFVQIAHYPLFREIDSKNFPNYERKNILTSFVTVPMMTVELFSGLYLFYKVPDKIFLYSLIALGVIWLSTFIFQIPIHLKLMKTKSLKLISKLILTNWIRTLGWTLRSALLLYILNNKI
tara:strand:+ start:62740 stop:63114 length:375 start_codon:yes stop_codon:yes gene_type:complete